MGKANPAFATLVARRKSGGNLSYEAPIFHQDDKILIAPCGTSFHCYNTVTGDSLPCQVNLQDTIISCQVHPLDSSKVLGCSSSGDIVIFSTSPMVEVKRFQLKISSRTLVKQNTPIHLPEQYSGPREWETLLKECDVIFYHLCAVERKGKISMWATWALDIEEGAHLSCFNFDDGVCNTQYLYKNNMFKKQSNNFLCCFDNCLLTMGKDFIICFKLIQNKQYKSYFHYIGREVELTCIAVHPQEELFATGDSIGRIYIWHEIFSRNPLKEILHWHSSVVKTITFSAEGNHLFSGGEESVLVKWSLHSQQRYFLPRLSSPIFHIRVSSYNSIIAVSTADSKIILLNSNFVSLCTIQHFSRWSSVTAGTAYRSVFSFDPKSYSLVLNGKTGHLQFLSANNDGRFLYTLDITNKNLLNSVVSHTEVTHAKFSRSGAWLVTAEIRKDGNSTKELRLKFWNFDDVKQQFKLNTDIEMPHEGDGSVVALEYGMDDLVLTTGNNETFKIWSRQEYTTNTGDVKSVWLCQATRSYRSLPCGPADFSFDGSLAAVGFGPALTVWETTTSSLKCSLTSLCNRNYLKTVKFGNQDCSHYVVVATDFTLCCWNLVTVSMVWTVPINLTALVSDPYSPYIAGFSLKRGLFLFKPSSSQVEFQLEKCSCSKVIAACFVPTIHTERSSQLFFINEEQELMALEDSENNSQAGVDNASSIITPYAMLLPETSTSEVSKINQLHSFSRSNLNFTAQLMSAPAHTLPPISFLCSDFLKNITLKETKQTKQLQNPSEFKKSIKQSVGHGKEKDVSDDDEEEELSKLYDLITQM